MANKLPVDFQEKVKAARPVDGKGYPYQISAKDLMQDFNYLLGLIPEGTTDNDILYWKTGKWQILPASETSGTFVLATVDGSLQWLATEECA